MMAERVLTLRELNRATLARQLLLERAALAPPDAVERLVAMQGQVSNAPYIGLWTRLQDFQRADLSRLLEQRQVVRASSLRGTLHLMSAEDYLHIHPILQPALSRNLHLFARQTPGFDMERFTALMRSYVQEQPHTAVELRARMEELYPGMGQPRIADSVRMHLALIQPSPSGLWGFTGKPTHTEATAWLGRPLAAPDGGSRRLVLRYLAAFGPASVQDIQTWSGVSRLQQTVDILRP
ncbi:MAG: winged helix DNA-binding domain-containing protein, partial [Ktedonobacterales bacterium]